jgi:hypothetical protein
LQYRSDHVTAFDTDASERLPWYTCACCPPNLSRLIGSLHGYLVSAGANSINVHLYSSGQISTALPFGQQVDLEISTQYPKNGSIKILVRSGGEFGIKLRIPSWCLNPEVSIEGVKQDLSLAKNGYIEIYRNWAAGDVVTCELPMVPQFVKPHPRIDASRGCVAIQRGPVVYSIEQADVNQPNVLIDDFVVNSNLPIEESEITLDGMSSAPVLQITGTFNKWQNQLPYVTTPDIKVSSPAKVTAIPYSQWGNRTKGGMRVWIPFE